MTAAPIPTPVRAPAASALLAVVEATLRDLRAASPDLPPVTLESVLDEDLGFDSLARMELLLRTERAFGIALPEDTLQRTETVADLLRAVQQCAAAPHRAPGAATTAVPLPAAIPLTTAGVAQQGAPQTAVTLLDVLEWHLQAHPDQTQIVYLHDGSEQRISYRQLADAAAAIASGLQHAGVVPRQSVAIMLPTSPEYFSTYFGILMAGAIPVPIYPPARPSQLEDHVRRHTGILDNAQAVALVTVPESTVVARLLQARVPGLRRVVTPQQLAASGGTPTPVALRGDDNAFIQYTSGSTGNPKGVALSHANLLANIRAMAQAVQATPRDVFVSWLPLYHDMGLIGAWLGSLYVGFPLVVMSPLAFLAQPLRWLQAIHRWRGTLSAGPNFAYELCLKRIDDAALGHAGPEFMAARLQRRRGREPGYRAPLRAALRRLRPAARGGGAGLRPGRSRGGAVVSAAGPRRADRRGSARAVHARGPRGRGRARRCERAALRRLREAVAGTCDPHRRRRRPRGWRNGSRAGSSSAGRRPRAAISATPRRPPCCFTTAGSTAATAPTAPAATCTSPDG